MKTNKLLYILSIALVLVSVASFNHFAIANDDRNGEDHGKGEHEKQVHQNGSTLEVHILDNGKVLVRGAKISSISGNTVNAYTAWGSINLNWQVNVLSNAKMVRKYGGNGSISEMSVGDIISFQGDLVSTSGSPIIVNASVIKDWSIQKITPARTTIEGKIQSITNGIVVVRSGDKDYTINISSTTSILNVSWLKTTVSSFAVGDGIRVYGLINSTNMTIDANVVRDTSLK